MEMSHRRRVQRGLFALDVAAVKRVAVAVSLTELEQHGVSVPRAIHADIVRIQPRGVQGANPFAEQPRLK